MDTQKLDAAISEAIASLLAISTALKQAEQPPAPEPLKVGDWVNETCWGNGQILDRPRDTDGRSIPPEALAGRDNWTVKFVSGRHGSRDPRGLICEADTLTRIDQPAPEQPAQRRYKTGDIVLVPCRVVETDSGNPDDFYTYAVHPLGMETHNFWFTRAALEPEPPQVGDTCAFFDSTSRMVRGTLSKIRDNAGSWLKYEDNDGTPYCNAIKVQS